ncbi:MAG: hypothetical protein IT382_11425 [Deltaproteobacteria bacterium]|nr:hypothetical protein [Deltaproteobacteria bacterium]
MRALLAAVLFLALLASLTGCPVASAPDGTKGQLGVALFAAESELVFSTTLVVGSQTTVSFSALSDEEPLPEGATLQSSDAAVLTVGEPDAEGLWPITLAGPGRAELVVVGSDGTVADRIELSAAVPAATTLVDGDLFAATTEVDSRLPAEGWAFLVDRELSLLVSAVDRCGGDLLDLHASTLRAGEGAPASLVITAAGPASFTVESADAGDVELTLETPGLDAIAYPVQSLEAGEVDEVRVSAASADDGGQMGLWGRAFANDVEVVGPLRFSWRADPRVALSAAEGQAIQVQISLPAEGEPPDDRPATVTAEILGEEGTLDLFTANQEIDRGAPARSAEVEGGSSGCGGEACDPFAAAGLLGALVLRRRLSQLGRRAGRRPGGDG